MTYIIAEAGVNHNGQAEVAHQLIEVGAQCGANAVKFQTFKADKLVTQNAQQAVYQQKNVNKSQSQYELLKNLEISYADHLALAHTCQKNQIDFMSTAFDIDSLYFLIEELGVDILKIPSGDITNAPYLLAHAQFKKRIILSTGMASLSEIEQALGVLAFGLMNLNEAPCRKAFELAYSSNEGQNLLNQYVTVLHCTTEYPAPFNQINLQAMKTLQTAFKLPIGYSDHSAGIEVSIAAVALGAQIIEKHFTLDKAMEGPDHKASLNPKELSQMVSSIRNIELAMGDGIKRSQPAEILNKSVARRSLVAASDIASGDIFNAENIAIKRPGNGMSPFEYWDILGSIATQKYQVGDLIEK